MHVIHIYGTRVEPSVFVAKICYYMMFPVWQGVITDDVVGRPTELRFFYKEQENDNYVVYFPNFNLTKRDPGMISGFLLLRLKLFAKKCTISK